MIKILTNPIIDEVPGGGGWTIITLDQSNPSFTLQELHTC